jgi:hypothetical protein
VATTYLRLQGHEVIVIDNMFTGRKKNVQHWIGHPNFMLLVHDVVEPIMLEVRSARRKRTLMIPYAQILLYIFSLPGGPDLSPGVPGVAPALPVQPDQDHQDLDHGHAQHAGPGQAHAGPHAPHLHIRGPNLNVNLN